MKTVMFIIVLTMFALSACGGVTPISSIPTSTPVPPPIADVTESPTIESVENTLIETPAVQANYEKLSPSKIRIPEIDLTFELSGRLTQSVLDINNNISVPASYLTIFPANTEPYFIQEFKLSTLSLPLNLEPSGGGGGAGTENGIFMTGGTQSYQVKTPLTVGQKIQITMLLTFNEYVNVKGVIPLTIELIVEPTSTTPEG
jgi:hypothetical protein